MDRSTLSLSSVRIEQSLLSQLLPCSYCMHTYSRPSDHEGQLFFSRFLSLQSSFLVVSEGTSVFSGVDIL
jgi:hypothetical protein